MPQELYSVPADTNTATPVFDGAKETRSPVCCPPPGPTGTVTDGRPERQGSACWTGAPVSRTRSRWLSATCTS